MSDHTNTINIHHPGFLPYMATRAEESEWLGRYNRYHAALAADKGYAFYLKGSRHGTSYLNPVVWMVKEVATGLTVEKFEDRDEALKALDAIEGQS